MLSRAEGRRSHKNVIMHEEPGSSGAGIVDEADPGKERAECDAFVPMVELASEQRLSSEDTDDRAENDGHPEQRCKGPAEPDAAECSKAREQQDARGESHKNPCGSEYQRHVRRSRQGLRSPGTR